MLCGKLAALPLFFLLCSICQGGTSERGTKLSLKTLQNVELPVNRAESEGSCNTNACFAFSNSAFISPDDYKLQVEFVQLIADAVLTDPRAVLAAVQYGRELDIVQRLSTIGPNFESLKQPTDQKKTPVFIEPGVLWCAKELEKVPGEPARLILLADARTRILDGVFAAQAALDFRQAHPSNEIIVVGVKFGEDKSLLTNIAGQESRVFTVSKWSAVVDVVGDVVAQVCPKPEPSPCPCRCISASGPGPEAKRKALGKAKRSCKKFKKVCKVKRCVSARPFAFQCC